MSTYTTPYSFQTAASIIAGQGSLSQLVPRVQKLGTFRNAVIVTQPSIKELGAVDKLASELQASGISVRYTLDVKPEPTIDNIREVYHSIASEPVDLLIGIGGGSVLDAAKLFSVMLTNEKELKDMIGTDLIPQAGVPTVLVPTTAGTGSEVTPNAIVTLPDEELKIGVVSRHLLPQLVVLDPELVLGLPKPITAATGMDAFTHSFESYISTKANPISDMFALESIRLISSSLLESYHNGSNIEAREKVLVGSMYGGMALTAAGTAAVHALAYPLGGKFKVPHGVANSMLLPHVTEYNLDAIAPERMIQVARAMGLAQAEQGGAAAADAVIERIFAWAKEMEIPQDLRSFGVKDEDVESMAVAASGVKRLMDNNPKTMSLEAISAVYRKLLP